jgi:uncharacterized protein DUF2586
MGTGNVILNILDGGASITVPSANVQVVIGCAQQGTVNTVVATQSPQTLLSTFGYGPLTEAAALTCLAGGTVLAIRAATNAAGTATAVVFTGTGTSVITVTGAPYDDYYVQFKVSNGGTIGVAGITFQLSLDAGRHYGPILNLGTANTYLIPQTNITLNFGAGTLVTGDIAQFSTTAPAWNDTGIQSALQALQASQYAGSGWGSTHIVGVAAGSDVSTIAGYPTSYLETLANGYLFTRAIFTARDAHAPVAWGGAGETEAAWMTAIGTDYSAVSAKRACVGAGYYNMPSAFGNTAAGAPAYRRPLSWAAAAREVQVPPQRHIGRVSDGALSQIVVNPSSDPTDGFVYHDERINPGLDYLEAGFGVNRFMAAWTRIPNLPGFYITNPLLASTIGSQFYLLPLGLVMDVACNIVHQVAQEEIDADVRLNKNGTLYVNEALSIQSAILNTINADMTNQNMISSANVVVSQTQNVQVTNTVVINVTITARGYVLEEIINIGFSNPLLAG